MVNTSKQTKVIILVGICVLSLMPVRGRSQAAYDDTRLYRFIIQQNRAQAIMLAEESLITKSLAQQLARALRDVDDLNRSPGGKISSNYLVLEEQLIAKMGPEASKIHMGRSRNDMGATSERLIMREDTLELLSLLGNARKVCSPLPAKTSTPSSQALRMRYRPSRLRWRIISPPSSIHLSATSDVCAKLTAGSTSVL